MSRKESRSESGTRSKSGTRNRSVFSWFKFPLTRNPSKENPLENEKKQIFSEKFAKLEPNDIIKLATEIKKHNKRPEFSQLLADINHIHNYNDQQIRDKLSIKIDDIKIENFYTKYKYNIAILQYHLQHKTGGKSRRLKKRKAKTRKYKKA